MTIELSSHLLSMVRLNPGGMGTHIQLITHSHEFILRKEKVSYSIVKGYISTSLNYLMMRLSNIKNLIYKTIQSKGDSKNGTTKSKKTSQSSS